jgi:hypothetical protein
MKSCQTCVWWKRHNAEWGSCAQPKNQFDCKGETCLLRSTVPLTAPDYSCDLFKPFEL